MNIERRRDKQMPKDKVTKKGNVYTKEVFSGQLDKNPYILTFEIPGRGKVKINIAFEKEEDNTNLTL